MSYCQECGSNNGGRGCSTYRARGSVWRVCDSCAVKLQQALRDLEAAEHQLDAAQEMSASIGHFSTQLSSSFAEQRRSVAQMSSSAARPSYSAAQDHLGASRRAHYHTASQQMSRSTDHTWDRIYDTINGTRTTRYYS